MPTGIVAEHSALARLHLPVAYHVGCLVRMHLLIPRFAEVGGSLVLLHVTELTPGCIVVP